MTPLQIIQDPSTNLPICYNGSFRENLRMKISEYQRLISELSDSNHLQFSLAEFQQRNKDLSRGILASIDAYYTGNPRQAYNELKNALSLCNINQYLDKQHDLPRDTHLFRIRICKENYPLSKEDLFHIPFNLRHLVKTQRYSIPGLPSLYLANSIFTAWEELGRPDANTIHAVKVENKKSCKLLDLTTDFFARQVDFMDEQIDFQKVEYNLMIWPLLAACSFKVQHIDAPFKPEYIIPQLLLQWVNKNTVNGIKYSSTHIDINKMKHQGKFYNIVLPVKDTQRDHGYCTHLLSFFKSTQVLPYTLRQLVTTSDRFHNQESISSRINKDIRKIEILKGHPQPYYQTTFGIIEHNLNALQLEEFIIPDLDN